MPLSLPTDICHITDLYRFYNKQCHQSHITYPVDGKTLVTGQFLHVPTHSTPVVPRLQERIWPAVSRDFRIIDPKARSLRVLLGTIALIIGSSEDDTIVDQM
jgi:hypothetical protein